MAYFAKLDSNNVVIEIQKIANEAMLDENGVEQESKGIDLLKQITGWDNWKQTSYNTYQNTHVLGGTPFRKNYAVIGGSYVPEIDGFVGIKPPYDNFTINPETGTWDGPIPKPEGNYAWNEQTQSWDLIEY